MKNVFILAAGKSSRWNGVCKHLIPISGEPLIYRTIRLIHECDKNVHIHILSHQKELNIPGTTFLDTGTPTSCPAEALFIVSTHFKGINYVLTGDTFFTKELIAQILSKTTLTFFGAREKLGEPHPERFAAVIPESENWWISYTLLDCIGGALENELPVFATPKHLRVLSNLMRVPGIRGFIWWHVLPRKYFEDKTWYSPGITLVDDPMVIDFDRPDEYMRFIKRFYPNTPIEDLDYMNSELVKNYYDKQVRE